ncbi:MAG: hypothetical protein H0X65_12960 [Gemmatimonadetes bacterium]|nr:hypothetical protein [Gemmatimonadota bacterium]
MATLAKPLNRRLAALLDFGVAVSQVDAAAPAHGRRTLGAYFTELAAVGEAGAASCLDFPTPVE